MCNACGIKWKRKNNIGKKRKPRPEELPTINLPPRKKQKINYSRLVNSVGFDLTRGVMEGDVNPSSNSSIEDFGEGSDADEERNADGTWPDRLRDRERERKPSKRMQNADVGSWRASKHKRRISRQRSFSDDDVDDNTALQAMAGFAEDDGQEQASKATGTGKGGLSGLIDARFLKVATLELENLQQQQQYQDEITQLRNEAAALREELARKDRAIQQALTCIVPGTVPVTVADLLQPELLAELQATSEHAHTEHVGNAGTEDTTTPDSAADCSPSPLVESVPLASPMPVLLG